METTYPEYFQPLFVIYRMDGKEFVVPKDKAAHWNYLPMIETGSDSQPLSAQRDRSKAIHSHLGLLLAEGLESAAKKLLDLASLLRKNVPSETQIQQTAQAMESELIK